MSRPEIARILALAQRGCTRSRATGSCSSGGISPSGHTDSVPSEGRKKVLRIYAENASGCVVRSAHCEVALRTLSRRHFHADPGAGFRLRAGEREQEEKAAQSAPRGVDSRPTRGKLSSWSTVRVEACQSGKSCSAVRVSGAASPYLLTSPLRPRLFASWAALKPALAVSPSAFSAWLSASRRGRIPRDSGGQVIAPAKEATYWLVAPCTYVPQLRGVRPTEWPARSSAPGMAPRRYMFSTLVGDMAPPASTGPPGSSLRAHRPLHTRGEPPCDT